MTIREQPYRFPNSVLIHKLLIPILVYFDLTHLGIGMYGAVKIPSWDFKNQYLDCSNEN